MIIVSKCIVALALAMVWSGCSEIFGDYLEDLSIEEAPAELDLSGIELKEFRGRILNIKDDFVLCLIGFNSVEDYERWKMGNGGVNVKDLDEDSFLVFKMKNRSGGIFEDDELYSLKTVFEGFESVPDAQVFWVASKDEQGAVVVTWSWVE